MARVIKRYGNRKLYDTAESKYASLEDIAAWIREGEDVQVVDNASGEDVTGAILAQIISEEGRKKSDFLSSDLLHDLIRAGGQRVRQIQNGVDRFVKKSIDRLMPVGQVRQEMDQLRARLDQLERSLAEAEQTAGGEGEPAEPAPVKKAAAKKRPARKPAAAKAAAPKPAAANKAKTTSKTSKTKTRSVETKPGGAESSRRVKKEQPS